MTPHVVVDVGNSRVKWGRCAGSSVSASASLAHDEPAAWQEQLDHWDLVGPLQWVVSGVQPRVRDQIVDWARGRGDTVRVVEAPGELPLQVHVEHPEWVGVDRLLNAVGVNARRRTGVPAVVVDAGTAVTVDYVDESGAFCGGTILPGFRLMAQALHDYTALLPLVEVRNPLPPVPARSTPAAVEAGVYWAVAGGIEALIRRLTPESGPPPEVFLGGGDAPLLQPALGNRVAVWPLMTLEGIRLTAEKLP